MQVLVSVQGQRYKLLTVATTSEAIFQVTTDIQNGLVAGFDPTAPANIELYTLPSDPFEKWASVAPQNPARFDVWLAPDESEWIYDQPRGSDGRYISDDPDTPEKESAMRWVPHTRFNVT